jgi:hypothetical protein
MEYSGITLFSISVDQSNSFDKSFLIMWIHLFMITSILILSLSLTFAYTQTDNLICYNRIDHALSFKIHVNAKIGILRKMKIKNIVTYSITQGHADRLILDQQEYYSFFLWFSFTLYISQYYIYIHTLTMLLSFLSFFKIQDNKKSQ